MKKKSWKTKIRKATREAGTYKPYFDHVIDTLAGILERRDDAREMYEESEDGPVIAFTNKSGAENRVKNPLIGIIEDADRTALSYWKELGLTPAGLKKISDENFAREKEKAGNSLIRLLEQRQQSGG